MRDLPVVFWLLAAVVVALAHTWIPAPRWLLIHLTLLGAVTHSILVWSRYFTETLLRVSNDRMLQNRRLSLLDVGVLAVLVGVVGGWWPVTVIGGAAVLAAVVWHGASLLKALRSALAPRFGVVVRFYLAAAALLPVGVVVGVLLARIQTDPWHERLLVAHAAVNLLGWIGLTVTGTLITLWPTMLRTRLADGIERAAGRVLPVMLAGVAITVGGALSGLTRLSAAGLASYLVGLLILAPGFIRVARQRPPSAFPAASTLGAVCWLAGSLLALTLAFATTDSWAVAGERFTWFTPFLAAGFGAQILLGALSYLIPVALGGGPRAVAAATNVLDRAGIFRVTVLNGALLACVLPVPPDVRTACSALALLTLASFLPLLALAIRSSLGVRRAPADPVAGRAKRPGAGEVTPVSGRPPGTAVALGLVTVLVATVGGLVADEGVTTGDHSVAAGVTATGDTTVVEVAAHDMRFTPSTIEVPAGNRLVIELTNTDPSEVHDLVLDDDTDSGRLAPGESARVEVPLVGRDVDGWCSVLGHRQMGMTLQVVAVGADPDAGTITDSSSSDRHTAPGADAHGHQHGSTDTDSSTGEPAVVDPDAVPGKDFVARDPVLPPLTDETVRRRTFHIRDAEVEVAPGVTQTLWTYDGTAPGPVLHGRVGDTFVITLVNDGTIGHSIDFHAGSLAPDRPMRTIPPGARLTYRFTAHKAGIWMYHCSTMPMAAHIANGLFGAVVIEPDDLPPVDRSFLLVQSEFYLGVEGGVVDLDKVNAEEPDLVVFNGYAAQYDHDPLRARVGERVRIWVLDAGPNRSSAFHVIGGQFDTAYAEGAYLLRPGTGGSQSLGLFASQGGFVELEFPEAGHYPFVSHVMVDAERGAHGIVEVTARKR